MRYRLVLYDTNSLDKYEAERRYEYLGNRNAVWFLWFSLQARGYKHVEIYSLDGRKQEPEKGINGIIDYNL